VSTPGAQADIRSLDFSCVTHKALSCSPFDERSQASSLSIQQGVSERVLKVNTKPPFACSGMCHINEAGYLPQFARIEV
jgi:hypothetical protein